jgi:hypothetical protein
VSRILLPLVLLLAVGCAADYGSADDAAVATTDCSPRNGTRVVPALNYGRRYCFHVSAAPAASAEPVALQR